MYLDPLGSISNSSYRMNHPLLRLYDAFSRDCFVGGGWLSIAIISTIPIIVCTNSFAIPAQDFDLQRVRLGHERVKKFFPDGQRGPKFAEV